MEKTKTSSLRTPAAVFAIALGVGGAFALAPGPARACGMIEARGIDFLPSPQGERLLAAAIRAANDGNAKRARRIALRVASASGPAADVRARAWAVAGWASWRDGETVVAMRAFDRARRLDPGTTAIDTVLAQASPSESVADLKKVLAG